MGMCLRSLTYMLHLGGYLADFKLLVIFLLSFSLMVCTPPSELGQLLTQTKTLMKSCQN
jgi:hypothetical protein